MNLSAKSEYACLAMLQLAMDYASSEPLQAGRIAREHGIPSTFLVQILHELKRAGLVTSTRGASGGYRLSRSPVEISLADVLDVVEGNARPQCAAGDSPLGPVLLDVCSELSRAGRQRLEAMTLADLVERSSAAAEPMWYI